MGGCGLRPVHRPAGILAEGGRAGGGRPLGAAADPAGGLAGRGGAAHPRHPRDHGGLSARRHIDAGGAGRLRAGRARDPGGPAARAGGGAGPGGLRLHPRREGPDPRHRGHGAGARAAPGPHPRGRGRGAAPRDDADRRPR